MNVTAATNPSATALILNNGRVPVIRGKALFTAPTDMTQVIGSNIMVSYRGALTATAQQIVASAPANGGSRNSSANSNGSHNYWGPSPTNGSSGSNPNSAPNSVVGIGLTEEESSQPGNGELAPICVNSYGNLFDDHNHKPQPKKVINDASGMATIAEWLNKSPHQNGFIRVFLDPSTELAPNSPIPPMQRAASPNAATNDGSNGSDSSVHATAGFSSILVPCSLTTTVEQVCSMIGITPPTLCVQVNSGKVAKLQLTDRPLQIQTSILAKLGFDTGSPEIMREGVRKSLSYICRFLSAKQSKLVLPDVCKRISSYLLVKRPAPVLKTWERRLCSLCGSKLQIHKFDQHPTDNGATINGPGFLATTVFDLAGATVTESTKASANRNHPYTVRIELATGGSKRTVKLAFDTPEQKLIWTRHLKLAATNQSRSLDLSGSDLELLPEGAFQIADDVHVLNLKDNQLLSRPTSRPAIGSDDDLSSNTSSNSSQLNPAMLGFLDDVARFRNLQILNMSNNDLLEVPRAVFELSNLSDLNVGNNKIRELSPAIQRLQNIKQLNCQSNRLSTVPAEMLTLRRLVTFNVSFNRFLMVPETLARLTNMRYTHTEELQLAGNCLGHATQGIALTKEIIDVLEQVRKIDLRFNSIVQLVEEPTDANATSLAGSRIVGGPLPLASLQYCTILDLSFNRLERLDLREMKSLESLNVNNNHLTNLIVNGTLLKHLNASYNKLEYLTCEPNPDFLEKLDVSKNLFKEIPTCFHNCPFLVSANYGHNSITTIPGRYLFNNRRLRFLRLHCNAISSLDDKLFEDLVYVEELYVQSNAISALPDQLFNRAVKLKVLNVSKNRLRSLPRPLASLGDISRLQALYLSGNQLTDDVFASLIAFPRLKYLHLARNRLTNLDGNVLAQLEFLQDLNISENLLTTLPNELSSLAKLQTLRAHNNSLVKVMDGFLPEALQVLDLSCNRLSGHVLDIFPRNPLHLSELDLSGNTGLHFGDGEFISALNEQLQILAYDEPSIFRGAMAGSNIHHFGMSNGGGRPLANGSNTSVGSNGRGARHNAFSVQFGVARTAGSRNKPSVFARTICERFRSTTNESFAALFDGGLSSEVPKILQNVMPDLVEEECEGRSSNLLLQTDGCHMKRAFLSAHRELRAVGQRLGASAAVCHFIAPLTPPGDGTNSTKVRLFVGNVGDVEVLLCHRDGSFRVLTENFRVDSNVEEVSRAIQEGCVITDNCKVNGVADVTRMLGCGYLYPVVIPSPNVTVFDLDVNGKGNAGGTYATVVIANRNLWRFVSYAEVCQEITRTSIDSPLQAAKRLLDVAQCFGSTENIGIVVAQIFFPLSSVNDVNALSQNANGHLAPLLQSIPISNGHVLNVKPWTKERQTRKIAEINGAVFTANSRTTTTASLRRGNNGSLPPAASLDLNPYGISTVPTGAPHPVTNNRRLSETGSSAERGLSSTSSSSNNAIGGGGGGTPKAPISSGSSGTGTASKSSHHRQNKQHQQQHSGDDAGSTENSVDTVRTAIWVPNAILHQYGGPLSNLPQQPVRAVQKPQTPTTAPTPQQHHGHPQHEAQALSIRIDAADNPRKPRQTPVVSNGHHAAATAVRVSPPSSTSQPPSISATQLAVTTSPRPVTSPKSSPSPTTAVIVVPPVAQPAVAAVTEEIGATATTTTLLTDDSINSAVDTIIAPPAPFADYEFVSYL